MDCFNNSEANTNFNNAVNELVRQQTGHSILEQIEKNEIENLPDNYSPVMDFDMVVYDIRLHK
jgi:hypothetical protein